MTDETSSGPRAGPEGRSAQQRASCCSTAPRGATSPSRGEATRDSRASHRKRPPDRGVGAPPTRGARGRHDRAALRGTRLENRARGGWGRALRLALLHHLLDVELELLPLEDVAVRAAALARAARDAREQAARVELRVEVRVEEVVAPALGVLLEHRLGLLRVSLNRRAVRILLQLLAELEAVVRLVPLAERRGVHLDDRVLHERLRADELVVRRVVHHVDDARFARAHL
mmetsp:Transcript_14367/g.44834  ORF Transcript_14367/g.44834 Transcript_14367/m.44834 type:complete len:230 (+) Transcript_14367:896-1585(+)